MKLNAIGISSTNIQSTVEFYKLIGFEFSEFSPQEQHVEPITQPGAARLMIDDAKLIESITGQKPTPANHSAFALEFDTPAEVDAVVAKLAAAGHAIVKQPWDAFWGQRYAIVQDPDGYMIDLYAALVV
jgi:uncharacterized glyoxalase superfamily protein PhnB